MQILFIKLIKKITHEKVFAGQPNPTWPILSRFKKPTHIERLANLSIFPPQLISNNKYKLQRTYNVYRNLLYLISCSWAKLSKRCFRALFSMPRIRLCWFRKSTSAETSEPSACSHREYNMTWLEKIWRIHK